MMLTTKTPIVEVVGVRTGVALWFAGLYAVAARRPPWGDEVHYLATVRLFGHGLDLERLRSYPELTGPLPFMTYAAWGHLAGFETWPLRLLSSLLAILTCCMFDSVMIRSGVSFGLRVFGLAMIACNPYVVGLSVFVFTDMLALLLLVIVLWASQTERPWLVGLGIALGLLTRQYQVFLAAAVLAAALAGRRRGPRDTRPQFMLWTLVALLPFGALAWFWRGLSPNSFLRAQYLDHAAGFDVHALSLYLAVPGAYLAPLLLWRSRRGLEPLAIWSAVPLALLPLFWPVRPSAVQVAEGSLTVGFLHKAFSTIGSPMFVSVAMALAALLWLTVMSQTALVFVRTWRRSPPSTAELLPWTAVVSFLVVMPWTYMPWEKYAVPLLVCATLALVQPERPVVHSPADDVTAHR